MERVTAWVEISGIHLEMEVLQIVPQLVRNANGDTLCALFDTLDHDLVEEAADSQPKREVDGVKS